MPQFTEDHLRRIMINPFYVITFAPQLTAEHDPVMSEIEWVWSNASLIINGANSQESASSRRMKAKGAREHFPIRLDLPGK